MDSTASNWYASANVDDDSCVHVHVGCMDSTRANYDPMANVDSGACAPVFPGCTDRSGLNFEEAYTVDDGSCSIPGCTDSSSSNFLASASFDDLSCISTLDDRSEGRRLSVPAEGGRQLTGVVTVGCVDPAAVSFDPLASTHDSSMCSYDILGCTDSTASNFLGAATAEASPSPSQLVLSTTTRSPRGTTAAASTRDGAVRIQPRRRTSATRTWTTEPVCIPCLAARTRVPSITTRKPRCHRAASPPSKDVQTRPQPTLLPTSTCQ